VLPGWPGLGSESRSTDSDCGHGPGPRPRRRSIIESRWPSLPVSQCGMAAAADPGLRVGCCRSLRLTITETDFKLPGPAQSESRVSGRPGTRMITGLATCRRDLNRRDGLGLAGTAGDPESGPPYLCRPAAPLRRRRAARSGWQMTLELTDDA
jgi:hypothetical protein